MEMIAQINLKIKWEIGKMTLNEFAYEVDKALPKIGVQLLEQLCHTYQDEICNRLRPGHSSIQRAGLGRHTRKGSTSVLCRGRSVRRRGYRWDYRRIKSKFGTIWIRLQNVECMTCGKQFNPLLEALGIEPYKRHDEVIENAVLDAVIDTNYRRLIEGHGIDISLGGIHDYIAGSDIDDLLCEELDLDRYHGVMADGTGLKKKGGKRGELRVLVGITAQGRLEPIGSWTDTSWEEIEKQVRRRIKGPARQKPLFNYDGEQGLEHFLAAYFHGQNRCTWHAPRGLYHAMWEDGHGKKDSRPHRERLAQIIAVEIPEDEYDCLAPEAIDAVRTQYGTAKKELTDLTNVLRQQNCPKAVTYLENLSKGLFKQVEMWLETGIIAPKTTSRLERLFRELGRRLKRIAWGWSDRVATKLSKMIMIKKYNPDLWKKYWMKKMGINGNFKIWIQGITITPCLNF